ncbi:transposase domain-containing protein [Azospirillum sp. TSO35-2]|uniref:transposase domain-containing protein n=1 Tax=Azospirillum sp. TSO35-2 TaxID=716796 RepID=UPI000D621E0C|nr:transposase domain-containing protein [Azospirillum sp. TSO35-2]PWC38986.1 hypothetical protein TSO352_01680 [Azospirillum sp. TSO35-2]
MTPSVLGTMIPPRFIDAVLTETGHHSVRRRPLLAWLVVYCLLALALYAQASDGEMLRDLLEGGR